MLFRSAAGGSADPAGWPRERVEAAACWVALSHHCQPRLLLQRPRPHDGRARCRLVRGQHRGDRRLAPRGGHETGAAVRGCGGADDREAGYQERPAGRSRTIETRLRCWRGFGRRLDAPATVAGKGTADAAGRSPHHD